MSLENINNHPLIVEYKNKYSIKKDILTTSEIKKLLKKTKAKTPQNYLDFVGISYLEVCLGKYSRSIDALDRALRLASNNYEKSRIHVLYGLIEINAKQYSLAGIHYQQAMDLDSNNHSASAAYYDLADLMDDMGNSEEAIKLYEDLVNNRWSNPMHVTNRIYALNSLAMAYHACANFLKARICIRLAFALVDDDQTFPILYKMYHTKSLIEYSEKKYPACIESAELALSIDPDYVLAHHNKFLAYSALNQLESAAESMRKVSELCRDNDESVARVFANTPAFRFQQSNRSRNFFSMKNDLYNGLSNDMELAYICEKHFVQSKSKGFSAIVGYIRLAGSEFMEDYQVTVYQKNGQIIFHHHFKEEQEFSSQTTEVYKVWLVNFYLNIRPRLQKIIVDHKLHTNVVHVGYGLGAALAEISAYDLKHRFVTFDSSGSKNAIAQLQKSSHSSHAIHGHTYMSGVWWFNTRHDQAGTIYLINFSGVCSKQYEAFIDSKIYSGAIPCQLAGVIAHYALEVGVLPVRTWAKSSVPYVRGASFFIDPLFEQQVDFFDKHKILQKIFPSLCDSVKTLAIAILRADQKISFRDIEFTDEVLSSLEELFSVDKQIFKFKEADFSYGRFPTLHSFPRLCKILHMFNFVTINFNNCNLLDRDINIIEGRGTIPFVQSNSYLFSGNRFTFGGLKSLLKIIPQQTTQINLANNYIVFCKSEFGDIRQLVDRTSLIKLDITGNFIENGKLDPSIYILLVNLMREFKLMPAQLVKLTWGAVKLEENNIILVLENEEHHLDENDDFPARRDKLISSISSYRNFLGRDETIIDTSEFMELIFPNLKLCFSKMPVQSEECKVLLINHPHAPLKYALKRHSIFRTQLVDLQEEFPSLMDTEVKVSRSVWAMHLFAKDTDIMEIDEQHALLGIEGVMANGQRLFFVAHLQKVGPRIVEFSGGSYNSNFYDKISYLRDKCISVAFKVERAVAKKLLNEVKADIVKGKLEEHQYKSLISSPRLQAKSINCLRWGTCRIEQALGLKEDSLFSDHGLPKAVVNTLRNRQASIQAKIDNKKECEPKSFSMSKFSFSQTLSRTEHQKTRSQRLALFDDNFTSCQSNSLRLT
jgi:tetratricopeptide (TPR) repeat protein